MALWAGGAPQDEGGDFGGAAEADWAALAEASAYVLDEGREVVGSEAQAGAGGADEGETDLAAVEVAGQHEVEVVVMSPLDAGGGVAEEEAEVGGGEVVERGMMPADPRAFGAGDEEGFAADGVGEVAAAHAGVVEGLEGVAERAAVAGIVVAQDEKCAVGRVEEAEGRGEPVEELGMIDDVAGEGDNVRVEGGGGLEDILEIFKAGGAVEVEIGEMEEGEAVPFWREIGEF